MAYHVHVQNLVEQDAAAVAPAQAPPQEVEVGRAQARPWEEQRRVAEPEAAREGGFSAIRERGHDALLL